MEMFTDGIVTVITTEDHVKLSGERIFLDEGVKITLGEIVERFPDVIFVIYERSLNGEIWRYGNHRDIQTGEKLWEKVGETCGFA